MGKRKLFGVLSLEECNNLGLTSYVSSSVIIGFPVSARDASKFCCHKVEN